MKVLCPACGGEDIQTFTALSWLRVPCALPTQYEEVIFRCNACREMGDFTGENDKRIQRAVAEAENHLVKYLLVAFEERGYSRSYLSRVLKVPIATIEQWCEGIYTPEALVLLRILYIYPWLLGVADGDFKFCVAREKVMEASAAYQREMDRRAKRLRVSREEALRIVREQAERAEKERGEAADKEAATGVSYADEETDRTD